MKLTIVTDAWSPQVNGVVTTLQNVSNTLNKRHKISVLNPSCFRWKIPIPFYPEIKMAIDIWKTPSMLDKSDPKSIHIATEGPIGLAARIYCGFKKLKFTTSYHTQFPEYGKKYISEKIGIKFLGNLFYKACYKYMKWFHSGADRILATTPYMKDVLVKHGFNEEKIIIWTRGVDTEIFKPWKRNLNKKPIFVYMGRISKEKNIEAFLEVENFGQKWVIGDGPEREELEQKYPDAQFFGYMFGKELAEKMSQANVFVFPSKTDTFGIVNIEANACGLPVACFNEGGHTSIVHNKINGYKSDKLDEAISGCLFYTNKESCIDYAKNFTWDECARILEDNLILKS